MREKGDFLISGFLKVNKNASIQGVVKAPEMRAGGFYFSDGSGEAIKGVTFTDGVYNRVAPKLSFNRISFYLTPDSKGNPVVNSKIATSSTLSITDGVKLFSPSVIKVDFSRNDFYLTTSKVDLVTPVVNFKGLASGNLNLNSIVVSGTTFIPPIMTTAARDLAGLEFSAVKGQIYYDSTFNCMMTFNGRFWVPASSGGNLVALEDDFMGGVNTTGNIGNIGWSFINSTVGGVSATPALGKPGIARARVTSGTHGAWTLAPLVANTATVDPQDIYYFGCIIRPVEVIDTNVAFRFGFTSGWSAAPTNGIYFEKQDGTAATVWQCTTMNASTATRTDTAVTVANGTFATLEFYFNGTTVYFYINNVFVASSATNIPATGTFLVSGLGGRAIAATKDFDVDYCKVILKSSNTRFT